MRWLCVWKPFVISLGFLLSPGYGRRTSSMATKIANFALNSQNQLSIQVFLTKVLFLSKSLCGLKQTPASGNFSSFVASCKMGSWKTKGIHASYSTNALNWSSLSDSTLTTFSFSVQIQNAQLRCILNQCNHFRLNNPGAPLTFLGVQVNNALSPWTILERESASLSISSCWKQFQPKLFWFRFCLFANVNLMEKQRVPT